MALIKTENDLTNSERIVLDRRRMQLTQKEQAAYYDIPKRFYVDFEHNRLQDIPVVDIGPISDSELCFLYRRRARIPQAALGAILGYSRVWINVMERGHYPCKIILDYWESING